MVAHALGGTLRGGPSGGSGPPLPQDVRNPSALHSGTRSTCNAAWAPFWGEHRASGRKPLLAEWGIRTVCGWLPPALASIDSIGISSPHQIRSASVWCSEPDRETRTGFCGSVTQTGHLQLWPQSRSFWGCLALPGRHSYGEYVFDHSWASAFHRYGRSYYPKMQSCVPFTPVTGPRLLLRNGPHRAAVLSGLCQALKQLCQEVRHATLPALELTSWVLPCRAWFFVIGPAATPWS